MDFCRNISVSGGVPSKSQSEQLLSSSSCSNKLGTLDELFSNHSTAEGDVSLEWLSIFVEDCFSNRGNHCLPPAAAEAEAEAPTTNELQKKKTSSVDIIAAASKPRQQRDISTSSSLQKFVIPVRARSKRKRGPIIKSRTQVSSSCWSHMTGCSSDPPLLQQAYWLADSELILPKKEDDSISTTTSSSRDRDGDCGREKGGKDEKEVKEEAMVVVSGGGKDKRGGRRLELVDEGGSNANIGGQQQQARRCSHCLAQRTPQWRAGPLGPKTLCNACGVRFKSGRLLPEYRPAKSPTFVSYKHSNSHKKVLEMRQSSMALHLPPSSIPTHQY